MPIKGANILSLNEHNQHIIPIVPLKYLLCTSGVAPPPKNRIWNPKTTRMYYALFVYGPIYLNVELMSYCCQTKINHIHPVVAVVFVAAILLLLLLLLLFSIFQMVSMIVCAPTVELSSIAFLTNPFMMPFLSYPAVHQLTAFTMADNHSQKN